MLVAVLDANVLFPASLRDILLRTAAAGLYRLHWSENILDEVRRNLVIKRGLSSVQIDHLISMMTTYFDDALVDGYQSLIEQMANDPKDRHVLAVAVHVNAQIIVTQNLQDFPNHALAPYGIEAQSPDEFLCLLLDRENEQLCTIIHEQSSALKHPPMTPQQLLDTLAQHVPRFVQQIRQMLGY